MFVAVFSVILIVESCFRIYYFGPEAVYKFWEYSSRGFVHTQFVEPSSNPDVGYKLAPNKSGIFKGAKFTTNHLGLRGPETTIKKPKETYRIAVLGASKDMGSGVADDLVYTSILQQQFDEVTPGAVEIINFSIGGYRTRKMEAYFWEYIEPYSPDLVLISIYVDKFPVRSGPRKFRPNKICMQINCLFIDLFSLKASQVFMRDFILDPLSRIGLFGNPEHWNGSRKKAKHKKKATEEEIYTRFINNLKSHQYNVTLMWLPYFGEGIVNTEYKKKWSDWTKKMNPELIIDNFPLSGKERPIDYQIYYGDTHPNALGHAVFAEGIFDALLPFVETKLSEKQGKLNYMGKP